MFGKNSISLCQDEIHLSSRQRTSNYKEGRNKTLFVRKPFTIKYCLKIQKESVNTHLKLLTKRKTNTFCGNWKLIESILKYHLTILHCDIQSEFFFIMENDISFHAWCIFNVRIFMNKSSMLWCIYNDELWSQSLLFNGTFKNHLSDNFLLWNTFFRFTCQSENFKVISLRLLIKWYNLNIK